MKKIKEIAVVAILCGGLLSPIKAEAKKTPVYEPNPITGCMETVTYSSIFWGAIKWNRKVIEEVCPDGPVPDGSPVEFQQIDFDDLINL